LLHRQDPGELTPALLALELVDRHRVTSCGRGQVKNRPTPNEE
jgi:hypothetical protein